MSDQLVVLEKRGFGLVTIMARNGVDHLAIGDAFGMVAPNGCFCTKFGSVTLIGTGPGVWLVLLEQGSGDWMEGLPQRLADVASISDQSGGYVLFEISGPAARALLQRGAFIDFSQSEFVAGSVAVTVIAHIGVIIWQVDEADRFNVAVFRSFARSFRDWLDSTQSALNY